MEWDRHELLWNGTEKYVPWTSLEIALAQQTDETIPAKQKDNSLALKFARKPLPEHRISTFGECKRSFPPICTTSLSENYF